MTVAIIDFESKSNCDLKAAGAYVYSEDPTTDVICMSYKIGDAATKTWIKGDPPPTDLFEAIEEGCWVVAHNNLFDKSFWVNVMVSRYGWPEIPDEQWFDTMASCARKAIPLDLETACKVLRVSVQKDMEGNAALKKIMKPNPKTGEWNKDPELYQKVYDYCPIDVEATHGVLGRLGALEPREMEIFQLSQKMNWRGLRLDLDFASDCQAVIDGAIPPLREAFEELVGCKAGSHVKVRTWVNDHFPGREMFDDLKAETVEHALENWELPPDVVKALELRKAVTSSSVAKLKSMRACCSADGRARGLIQYHGATTGRDAGRLLQPQNFPRGTIDCGEDENGDPVTPWSVTVPVIQSRDHEFVTAMFGCSVQAVQSALRHCLVAAPGHVLVAGDFSTIEARIVLCLAGQYDKIEVMKAGGDIYCDMAEAIFDRPVSKKTDPEERQTGKNSVLGLGFQMGAKKFRQRYAKTKELDFAKDVVNTYRNEWAPLVPKLWEGLYNASLETVWTGRTHSHAGCTFRMTDGWLTCEMPSGRKLYYFKPRKTQRHMPWSTEEKPDIRPGWSYLVKRQGVMVTNHAYGGLLTENIVQALARDLLYDRAPVAEREGYPLVLTVHDELVCEVPEGYADPDVLGQIMEDAPRWAIELGIPVAAECWAGDRYRK